MTAMPELVAGFHTCRSCGSFCRHHRILKPDAFNLGIVEIKLDLIEMSIEQQFALSFPHSVIAFLKLR